MSYCPKCHGQTMDGIFDRIVCGLCGSIERAQSDFTIEVNSDGLTMIRCHRMLTPESLAELRDKLGRLAPGEGDR